MAADTSTGMDLDAVWRAIDERRAAVADLLGTLNDDEWATPSLCAGWTVRDVAAHLTRQELTIRDGLLQLLRHPGGLNRSIRDAARRRAELPTDELVARIRAGVGRRRHNTGVTPRETLVDICVHGQDIAVPLGRPLPIPPAAAVEAAARAWALRWPWNSRRRFAGLRFTATDIAWTVGDGAPVQGPAEALLLVLTCRDAGLPRLTGNGVATLRERLRPGG